MVQPGTGRLQDKRKELARKCKGNTVGRKKRRKDFILQTHISTYPSSNTCVHLGIQETSIKVLSMLEECGA
jgi:hypothetical protein